MTEQSATETELAHLARPCAVCPKKTILGCSVCKNIFFCSTKCQRLVWKAHDLFCRGTQMRFNQPDLLPVEKDYIYNEIGYNRQKAEAQIDECNRWQTVTGGNLGDYEKLMKPAKAARFWISRGMFDYDWNVERGNHNIHPALQNLRASILRKFELQTPPMLPKKFPIPFYFVGREEDLMRMTREGRNLIKSLPKAPWDYHKDGQLGWYMWRNFINKYLRQVLIYHVLRHKLQESHTLVRLALKRKNREYHRVHTAMEPPHEEITRMTLQRINQKIQARETPGDRSD